MRRRKRGGFLSRTLIVLILTLLSVVPVLPQGVGPAPGGNIGASNGEIAGVLVGAGAAVAVIVIVIYHETHKHHKITGCVSSGADRLSVVNEKDNKVYILSGESGSLRAGERVTLKGRKLKDSSGAPGFRVEKLERDYGACHS
jgi:hypothetical protein